jgi:periplasmic divalent cation tolerance protein
MTLYLATTTCPTAEVAQSLATAAVTQGLAACAQVGQPITSTYRWQGKLCTEVEIPLLFKVMEPQLASLQAFVIAHHPYEVPQWVVWPASTAHCLPAYLAWCQQSTPSL